MRGSGSSGDGRNTQVPGGSRTYGGHPYADEQKVAVEAAEEAGTLLRNGFAEAHTVRCKGDGGDVVTDLDLAAEQVVLDRLRTRFPHDRIVSEEAGLLEATGARSGPGGDRTWLVDPLDGSNNVAIGLTAYAVGIALCVGGSPVVGVVHEPVTGRTWHASLGRGAWCGSTRLHGPSGELPRSGPVLAWTQGHTVSRGDPHALALRGTLELHGRRVLQLWAPLLGWTMLASGTVDGYVGYRAEAVDFPAGALLASEAGVEFRTLTGGPFHVGFEGPDTARCFVASRGDVLPHLLELSSAAAPPRAA
jgi:myo-inositol-1(or 4)-monophosphatase